MKKGNVIYETAETKRSLTFHVMQEECSETIEGWSIGDGWVIEGDKGNDSLTHTYTPWG